MSSSSVGDEAGYESGEGRKTWSKVSGPSAGLVKAHYVKARQADLYRRNRSVEDEMAAVLQRYLKGTDANNWLKHYHQIQKRLQAADLTINFNAESWFKTPNNFASYTQMYERSAVGADGRILLLSDKYNTAVDRASVDDKVTFPKSVGGPALPQRGAKPGVQSMQRIETQMGFGAPIEVQLAGQQHAAAKPSNARFNPRAKQVFCALNYGRRPHGSSTYYGASHLVWHDRFKVNAMFFPGDTFGESDTSRQTAYGTLATALKKCHAVIREDVLLSCYYGNNLSDTDDPLRLMEAHVFEEMNFKNNLKAIYLAAPKGSVYGKNAKLFAAEHGAKLHYV